MFEFLALSVPSSHLTSLGLRFLVCNMGLLIISTLLPLEVIVGIIGENRCENALQIVKHYMNVIFSHISTECLAQSKCLINMLVIAG